MSIRKIVIDFQKKRLERLRSKVKKQNRTYHSDLSGNLLGGVSTERLIASNKATRLANAKLRRAKRRELGRSIRRMKESKGKGVVREEREAEREK